MKRHNKFKRKALVAVTKAISLGLAASQVATVALPYGIVAYADNYSVKILNTLKTVLSSESVRITIPASTDATFIQSQAFPDGVTYVDSKNISVDCTVLPLGINKIDVLVESADSSVGISRNYIDVLRDYNNAYVGSLNSTNQEGIEQVYKQIISTDMLNGNFNIVVEDGYTIDSQQDLPRGFRLSGNKVVWDFGNVNYGDSIDYINSKDTYIVGIKATKVDGSKKIFNHIVSMQSSGIDMRQYRFLKLTKGEIYRVNYSNSNSDRYYKPDNIDFNLNGFKLRSKQMEIDTNKLDEGLYSFYVTVKDRVNSTKYFDKYIVKVGIEDKSSYNEIDTGITEIRKGLSNEVLLNFKNDYNNGSSEDYSHTELTGTSGLGYSLRVSNGAIGNGSVDVAVSSIQNLDAGDYVIYVYDNRNKIKYKKTLRISENENKAITIPESIDTSTSFDPNSNFYDGNMYAQLKEGSKIPYYVYQRIIDKIKELNGWQNKTFDEVKAEYELDESYTSFEDMLNVYFQVNYDTNTDIVNQQGMPSMGEYYKDKEAYANLRFMRKDNVVERYNIKLNFTDKVSDNLNIPKYIPYNEKFADKVTGGASATGLKNAMARDVESLFASLNPSVSNLNFNATDTGKIDSEVDGKHLMTIYINRKEDKFTSDDMNNILSNHQGIKTTPYHSSVAEDIWYDTLLYIPIAYQSSTVPMLVSNKLNDYGNVANMELSDLDAERVKSLIRQQNPILDDTNTITVDKAIKVDDSGATREYYVDVDVLVDGVNTDVRQVLYSYNLENFDMTTTTEPTLNRRATSEEAEYIKNYINNIDGISFTVVDVKAADSLVNFDESNKPFILATIEDNRGNTFQHRVYLNYLNLPNKTFYVNIKHEDGDALDSDTISRINNSYKGLVNGDRINNIELTNFVLDNTVSDADKPYIYRGTVNASFDITNGQDTSKTVNIVYVNKDWKNHTVYVPNNLRDLSELEKTNLLEVYMKETNPSKLGLDRNKFGINHMSSTVSDAGKVSFVVNFIEGTNKTVFITPVTSEREDDFNHYVQEDVVDRPLTQDEKDSIANKIKTNPSVKDVTVGNDLVNGRVSVDITYKDYDGFSDRNLSGSDMTNFTDTIDVTFIDTRDLDTIVIDSDTDITNDRPLTSDEVQSIIDKLSDRAKYPYVDSLVRDSLFDGSNGSNYGKIVKSSTDLSGNTVVEVELDGGFKVTIPVVIYNINKEAIDNVNIYTTETISNRELTDNEKEVAIRTILDDDNFNKHKDETVKAIVDKVFEPIVDGKAKVKIKWADDTETEVEITLSHIDNNLDTFTVPTDTTVVPERELTREEIDYIEAKLADDTKYPQLLDEFRTGDNISSIQNTGAYSVDTFNDIRNVSSTGHYISSHLTRGENALVVVKLKDYTEVMLELPLVKLNKDITDKTIYVTHPVVDGELSEEDKRKLDDEINNAGLSGVDTVTTDYILTNGKTKVTLQFVDNNQVEIDVTFVYIKDYSVDKLIFTTTPITQDRASTTEEVASIIQKYDENTAGRDTLDISNTLVYIRDREGFIDTSVTYKNGLTNGHSFRVIYLDKTSDVDKIYTNIPLDSSDRDIENGNYKITQEEEDKIVDKATDIVGVVGVTFVDGEIKDGKVTVTLEYEDGSTRTVDVPIVYVNTDIDNVEVDTVTPVEPNRPVTDDEKNDIIDIITEITNGNGVTGIEVSGTTDGDGKVPVKVEYADGTEKEILVELDDTNKDVFIGPVKVNTPVNVDRETTEDDRNIITTELKDRNPDIVSVIVGDIIRSIGDTIANVVVKITFVNGDEKTIDNFKVTADLGATLATDSDATLATDSDADVDGGYTPIKDGDVRDDRGDNGSGNITSGGSSGGGNVRHNTSKGNSGNNSSNSGPGVKPIEVSRVDEIKELIRNNHNSDITASDLVDRVIIKTGYTVEKMDIVGSDSNSITVNIKYTDGFEEKVQIPLGNFDNSNKNTSDNVNNSGNNSNANLGLPKTGDTRSGVSYILYALVSMLGLSGLAIKRKNEDE